MTACDACVLQCCFQRKGKFLACVSRHTWVRAVVFKLDSAELQDSAKGCQGVPRDENV
jgi:hypothetical protein